MTRQRPQNAADAFAPTIPAPAPVTAVQGLTFFVPVKTVSEANSHSHWRARQKRAKGQRETARYSGLTACGPRVSFPCVVHMTRVGARKLDSDNLQGALKHVRDGIADWLGIDDGDEALATWECTQEIGKPVGVRVRVEARRAGA